ncbi:phage tail tape measure C-terminal domain-containing protein [Limibacillus sp. MBR-115]|jgi:hypothetical protein|uniref:phage tail tape measure C-terminal domain-containing protein n=1 Tax=Limibacillus sp. MBR-115 TaxID=3156465 RepID=UPI00339AD5F6
MADANLRFNIIGKNRAGSAFAGINRALGKLRGAFSGVQGAVLGLVGVGGLGLLVSRSLETADRLDKVSKATGVSVQALQEYQFAARQSGLDTEKMNKGFQTLGKRLGELRQGTGALKTFLDKLDPAFADLVANAGSTEEAMDLILRKMAEMPDEADRAALSAAAFSKSVGVDMVNLVNGGVEALEALRAKARELLPITTEQAGRIASLNDAFDRFGTLLSNLVTRSLAALAPALENMTNGSLATLPGLFEGAARAVLLVKDNLDLLLNGLLIFASISIAGVVINQAIAFVKFAKAIAAVRTATMALAVAQKISRAGWLLIAAVLAVTTDQLDVLKRAITDVADVVERNFGGAMEGLKGLAETLGLDLSALTAELEIFKVETGVTADVATGALGRVRAQLGGLGGDLANLSDTGQEALGTLGTAAKDLGDGLETAIGNAIQQLEGIFLNFVNTGKLEFKGLINSILQQLAHLAVQAAIINPLKGIFGGGLGGGGGGLIGNLIGGLGSLFGGFFAKGGPVSGGKPIVVGEEGPELFVPGRSGAIVPNGALGRGAQSAGNTINVTVAPNFALGVQSTVKAEVMGLMPQIASVTKAAVAEATQRGGTFAQAVRAR